MASFPDLDASFQIDRGPHIILRGGNLSERTQYINLRHSRRRALNSGQFPGCPLAHLIEKIVFKLHGAFLGAEDPPFQLLELGGNESLAVGERLLADVLRRCLVFIGIADFNVIAKDTVIADLQLRDPGPLALLGLDLRDDPAPVRHIAFEQIQLLAVAGTDQPALAHRKRRIVIDSALNQIADVLKRIDLIPQSTEQGRLRTRQRPPKHRKAGQRRRQRAKFPCVRGTVHNPAHQTFQIVNAGKPFQHIVAQRGGANQLLHRVLTARNLSRTDQRLFDPVADQAFSHRGARAVQHPEKGAALFLGTHRFTKFQIAAGIQVQMHILRFAVELQLRHALQACALGPFQISQQRAERRRDQGLVRNSQIVQRLPGKLVAHRLLRFLQIKFFLGKQFQTRGEPFPDKRGQLFEIQRAGIQKNFPGRKAGQLIDQLFAQITAGENAGVQLARGDIGKAAARLSPARTDRADVIVLCLVQHAAFQNGAGRDNTDNVTLNQPFRQSGILHLLTDGNLISLLHQTRNVAFRAVERYAAHRRTLLLPAVAPGERQIQFLRNQLRVVKKHLVKIAQPEEKDRPGIFLLHLHILLHHWRKICHTSASNPKWKTCGRDPPSSPLRMPLP